MKVMADEPLAKVHRKSSYAAECGAVLGIDVGWGPKKPTTGLCLIEWTNREMNSYFCEADVCEDDRKKKLDRLVQGKRLLAVGIDGPLIPKLETANQYRAAEALLSRGKFQRRGKPGPMNGGSGPKLHKQATKLAKLVVNSQDVESTVQPYKIHDKAVAEAFPNAFLAVLHPDKEFPSKPKKNRQWTDTLFPHLKQQIQELLTSLLPQHKPSFSLDNIEGHETIASFVCALTALCIVVGRCVAIGDSRLGYILLPPLESWGKSIDGSDKWALGTLRDNLTGVRCRFNDVALYKDNELWTP